MTKESNKRKKSDRRKRELGPPDGWRERRRLVERRLPVVKEIPFKEWALCRCMSLERDSF
jgi:hypothetical protein